MSATVTTLHKTNVDLTCNDTGPPQIASAFGRYDARWRLFLEAHDRGILQTPAFRDIPCFWVFAAVVL